MVEQVMHFGLDLLILLLGMPDEQAGNERLGIEIDRVRKFRDAGRQGGLLASAVFVKNAEQAAVAIGLHRPTIVHFRYLGRDGALPPDLEVEALRRVFDDEDRFLQKQLSKTYPERVDTETSTIHSYTGPQQTRCVILENCYSLAWAEALAENAGAVVGINGRFTEMFLSAFYPRVRMGKLYYEVFREAEWSYFNQQKETKPATQAERPYFITLDEASVESGHAGLYSGVPGRGFAGRLFELIEPDNQPVEYPLSYGTNRVPVDSKDVTKGYAGERNDHVEFGTCTVVVPKSHKIGSLGSPWWRQLLTAKSDGRLKLQWPSLTRLAEERYWEQVRADIKKRRGRERIAVVYIHGYKVSFEGAALRAAQLGVDLKVEGIMSFFSWPSKGKFTGYEADKASIEGSEQEIAAYLTKLIKVVGNGRVHIIAHSMGNEGLLRSMKEIFGRISRKNRIEFGQIFLAAPDVDIKLFRDLAPVYKTLAKRATLYVSSKDLALASSGIIHDYPRAGYTPPITIVKGIDTVETSRIDLSFLGHGYFAEAKSVLQDMHSLLEDDKPPDRRFGLQEANSNGQIYWHINL